MNEMKLLHAKKVIYIIDMVLNVLLIATIIGIFATNLAELYIILSGIMLSFLILMLIIEKVTIRLMLKKIAVKKRKH